MQDLGFSKNIVDTEDTYLTKFPSFLGNKKELVENLLKSYKNADFPKVAHNKPLFIFL